MRIRREGDLLFGGGFVLGGGGGDHFLFIRLHLALLLRDVAAVDLMLMGVHGCCGYEHRLLLGRWKIYIERKKT